MPTIERATLDDVPQLSELLTILFSQEADFRPDDAKQQRGLRMIVGSPATGVIFVARAEGRLLGMVSLLFTVSTAEGGPACWLEDMIVRPEYRGGGLGSQLLESAVAYAREQGYLRITLLTDKANAPAIRFYRRFGFSESAMTPLRLNVG